MRLQQFDDVTCVEAFQAFTQTCEAREWERFKLPRSLKIDLSIAGSRFDGSVVNVSMGGALVSVSPEHLPISVVPDGARSMLKHPELAVIGTRSVWHSANLLGLRLDYGDPSLEFVAFCLRFAQSKSERPAENR